MREMFGDQRFMLLISSFFTGRFLRIQNLLLLEYSNRFQMFQQEYLKALNHDEQRLCRVNIPEESSA
jgi:hypothetical protein